MYIRTLISSLRATAGDAVIQSHFFLSITLIVGLLSAPAFAASPAWQTSLTLFGETKYETNFRHFDYANPDAPKGGILKLDHPATFDSLNAYIMKGVKAPGLSMLNETLLTSSLDEPQSYYPLIASAFRQAADKSWIEFKLNPQAKWHDGTPITAEDVVWSLEMIKTQADPVYRLTFAPLAKAEKTAARQVRFTFADTTNREAPLLAAGLPILPKHYYCPQQIESKEGTSCTGGVEFNKTTLTAPLGSGPYKLKDLDVGRFVTYERVADYWGKNLGVNRGRHNFDTIRYDVYRDATVSLEAFKAGEYDFRREYISRNWATAYNIPAVEDGHITKTELPSQLPQGMQAFFFNVRQPYLSNRVVREAIALTMDFEWINKTMFYGAYKRNHSFFQYTPFAAKALPEGEELALLEPFRETLPKALFTDEFRLPKTDGSGQNRRNLLKAQSLLEAAGFPLNEAGQRLDPVTGKPITIEFMLNQPTMQRVIMPMRKGLKRLGIEANIRIVDDAQYQRRMETRDFDIVSGWINLGVFFPGAEQPNYWQSAQADVEGSNNTTGFKSEAVDAMLTRIANAQTLEELEPPSRALDRILLWNHLVIPHWHSNSFRVAWWNKFGKSEINPAYGLAIDSWWALPDEEQ